MLKPKQIIVDLFLVKGLLLCGALITLFQLFSTQSYTLHHVPFFFVLGGSLAALVGVIKPNVAAVFISRKTPDGWVYKKSITLGILGGLFFAGSMNIVLGRAHHSSTWFLAVAGVMALVHTITMIWDARRLAQEPQTTSKTI